VSGIASAFNDPIAKNFSEEFSTPTLLITHSYPSSDTVQPLTPAILFAFNQIIDPNEVIKVIKLTSGKLRKSQTLSILPPQQIPSDFPQLHAFITSHALENNKWISLIPSSPLSYETKCTVTIGPKVYF
jgi:hypothetical protein